MKKKVTKAAIAKATKENVKNAKLQAKRLNEALTELGLKIPHGQALEVLAKAMGSRNWHAFQADLSKAALPPEVPDWKPTLGPMSFEQYQNRPCTCVVCGGTMIEGDEVNIEDGEAHQEVYCLDCGSEWEDVYRLARYNNLRVGDSAPMPQLLKIEAWLKTVVNEDDLWVQLGDLVVEAHREASLPEVNGTDDAAEQENHLQSAEQSASDINNQGVIAQLAYLKEGHPDMEDFTDFLAEEFKAPLDALDL